MKDENEIDKLEGAEIAQTTKPAKPTAEAQARELLAMVERYYKELNGRYEALKTQLKEFLKLNKEEMDELNGIKTEIVDLLVNAENEAIYQETMKGADWGNPAEQRQTERKSGVAEIAFTKLEKGEILNDKEKEMTASMLERRDWGNVYGNLEPGDVVMNISVPADKFLTIKHLNDVVFGQSHVDEILIAGRNILKDQFKKVLLKNLPELPEAQIDNLVLTQDYKNSVLKIDKATNTKLAETGISVSEIISEISAGVNEAMAGEGGEKEGFIYKLLETYRKTPEGKAKKQILDDFEEQFRGVGYRLNAGVSEVGETDEKNINKEIALSVARSSALSRAMEIHRLAESLGLEDYKISEGQEMNFDSAVLQSIKNFSRLGKEIMSANTLHTKEGEERQIFEIQNGVRSLNKDLLRDIRKDKLHAQDPVLFDKLTLYYRMLNLMDFVKPHTAGEIEGEKLEDGSTLIKKLSNNKDVTEKLKADGKLDSKKDREQVAKTLRSSEKSELYTSDEEFTNRALKIDDCTIISIDLLDVGVDQLLNYEQLLQEVENLREEEQVKVFQENVLKASDDLTERLRLFRKNITELLKNKKLASGEDLYLGKVGGDELTLALPTHLVDAELLFAVKGVLQGKDTESRTEARIVSSRVDRANTGDRLAEHKKAMAKSEAGIDKAKKIEETLRKLKKSGADYDFPSNFTIREDRDGRFLVVTEEEGFLDEKDFDTVMADLEGLLEKHKPTAKKKRKLKAA